MSWIKAPSMNSQSCPGIKDFVRPTVKYVKCHVCGGRVEIWSDENEGYCIDCNSEWKTPDESASCLEYCEHADKCRSIIEREKTMK
jgi:hypothetical protein